MPEILYLIDVYSLVFQVFHAIPEMTGPSGQPTNAVFGFTRDILNILKQKQPTHLICALDASGPGERESMYAEYKANRSSMPDDLRPQIPVIADVVSAFGIPMVEFAGWEADDVIATLAHQAAARGMEVCIVSNDKDVRQLISSLIRVYYVRKDTYMTAEELLTDWGVRPEQVTDFQALVGDAVDNVPGVPLVGPKKASALLQQFGTLDAVLANADAAPGAKLRENLKKFADQARLSHRLVTLRRDLPLVVNWEEARTGQLNPARLLELFTQCGFRKFGEEVREMAGIDTAAATRTLTYEVVDTPEKLATLVEQLSHRKSFCLDLETTSLDAVRADIVGWAISWEAGRGWYIPVQGPEGEPHLDPQNVVDMLRPILERQDLELVNQNLKYDLLVLRRAGILVNGLGMDPMVGHYLLDAGARSHGLDELARQYFEHEMIPISDLLGKGLFQKQMNEVEIAMVAEYASEDAAIAWELAEVIGKELRDAELWDLYWNLERPLIEVLVEMQHNGIRVEPSLLQEQSVEATGRLAQIKSEIFALAGHEFNIDSPIQLRQVLFEELAQQHPLPVKMLEHRRLSKLKSTYLDALPQMINPDTGRIHTSFNQVVAATGRLSSSEPNLQNIPIRTEEGRRVRQAFIAGAPGWQLLCADYSQIELRMLAHFSQDPALLTAFTEGVDIHTAVAAQVFGIDPQVVDKAMRGVAKAVNFGIIYGQSPFGLATSLGIAKDEAARFIEDYFARYAQVDRFFTQILEQAVEQGYVTTILGRRRSITGIRSTTGRQRNLAERTAINTVIQGSAADLIKQAMINVYRRLKREGWSAKLLLQIHDELVLDVPDGEISAVARLVQEEMEGALDLSVPLRVDLAAGVNWLETKNLEDSN